ncbi:alginate export family protein [Roseivirga sp. BDSF3-8]|uniref:alginate export family protein n=1 Tax=Roseivirga sp. BDSF3-8 TaxID=3241598 RepID=UPI0035324C3C
MTLTRLILSGILLLTCTQLSLAQFTLGAEMRPRAQFRNGYRTLKAEGDDPSFFISQRTRLNAFYQKDDLFTTYISLQDVRIWGDQDQLADEPSTGVFEAWARLKLLNKLYLKAGRQELSYEDGYLLGRLNWRQTGRSHDAGIFQYADSTFQADLGLAFNQDKGNIFGTYYEGDYYKSLQFLWMKKSWKHLEASFLFINRGMQMADSSQNFEQTFGPTLAYSKERFSLKARAYLQRGKNADDLRVNAHFWSAMAAYRFSDQWTWKAGADVLSGMSYSDAASPTLTETRTFDILYGLRHGHFGFMDYFYLNFTPTTGLIDAMVKGSYSPKKNLKLNADIHSFSSYAQLPVEEPGNERYEKHLGVETDLYLSYSPNDELTLTGGYSHMLATESMEVVKGGQSNGLNNWVWLALTFKPVFISTDKE